MTVTVAMTGSGEIGDIAPGWSVQEFATPVTIGNVSGGTGNVSLNAKALDESLFIVNNNIVTTEENLGYLSGVVKTVSQTGMNLSISHNTQLAIFDSNYTIPALGAGGMYSAVDLCSQLTARDLLLKSGLGGYFYSLQGHSAGFDNTAVIADSSIVKGSYLERSGGIDYNYYYEEQTGQIWANEFSVIGSKAWGTSITGDTFPHTKDIPKSRIMFKALPDGQIVSWGMNVKQGTVAVDKQRFDVIINPIAGTLTLDGMFIAAGTTSFFNQVLNIQALFDVEQELIVCVDFEMPTTGSDYTITVNVCPSADVANIANITQIVTAAPTIFNSPWGSVGNVRSVYRSQGTTLPAISWDYENLATYTVDSGIVLDGPVPSQPEANAWEYLQQACSAYGQELSVVAGVLIVRNIGGRTLSIENIAGAPTITPSMIFSGRSVEVVYSNAYTAKYQELYNTLDDGNRVISVKAAETITTTVAIDGTPTVIVQPTWSQSATSGVGEYRIIASNTDTSPLVPEALWSASGGRVEVAISKTAPNSIDIILTGPTSTNNNFNDTVDASGNVTAKALYTEPYKLAYTSGQSEYASLSVVGSGVRTKVTTLKLISAADPLKVSQEVAKTITNPFIATKQQAYDRGAWAAVEASGPSVTISGTIPVTALSSFGLTVGSLIGYRDSIYRVMDATIGNLSVSFNAIRHVEVSDFDEFWAGRTVGAHDLMWEGYDTSDQIIAPLRFIGDDEPVILALDTDTNPYYDFNDEPEISVFSDEDSNPYYIADPNANGAEDVYLDTDTNPYVED
jgi:hypothetical protein